MIIVSDPDIEQEAIALNIKATKDYFEGIVSNSFWWGSYMNDSYNLSHGE